MLYVMPAPVGAVMVNVPVGTEHVGWLIATVGTEGVVGCGLTVVAALLDTQLDVLLLTTT